ncbi:P-loop containing nucleoside triphosphate hydrolase protein [Xylariomycetidae sp. FL2044]|nr:P-loop containing nucleoside triphosphate hydrolase protein [Xylariomycetidae sp. FL2044]
MDSETPVAAANAAPKAVVTKEKTQVLDANKTSGEQETRLDQQAKLRAEREANFKDYIRVFKYGTRLDAVLMVAAALAAFASGVTLPLMNVVFGRLVNNFTGYFLDPPTVTRSQFQATLNQNALYIFALFIAKFGLLYINKFSFRMIGIRMSAGIRLDYLRSLFGQTIHVLDSMAPGAAADTITTTANTLQIGISEKLGTLLEFVATIIASIVIAFSFSWSLALVTSSVLLFIITSVGILLPFIVKGTARTTKAEAKSTSIANEAFSGIRMVTACGAEAQMVQRFAVWANTATKHGRRTAPLIALQFGLLFFAMWSAFGLCFWYGTKSYSEGRISDLGTVIIVLMSVMMMVMSFERIATPGIAISKAMIAACEFFIVIDAPRPDPGNLRGPDVSASNDIVFKDVDFAYPTRPHVKVLDQLNLRIKAGELTAIVGPSGSGKSTIVGLIERWYTLRDQHIIAKAIDKDKKKKDKKKKKSEEDDDDEEPAEVPEEEKGPAVELKGSIETCDYELEEINLKWWRAQIGLVQQEPFLFNDTIFKNVAHGLIGSELEGETEERKKEMVIEACKESFADEFIDRLPDGYETLVGDSGMKMSGGQRQRICIARAIIKRPKILILDEATSAIDVRGERIVQAALDKVSQGRTTITIAHRLSTIKKADTIIVLQKGKVVERGTHDSLLEIESGVYHGLVNAQQLSLGEPTESDDSDGQEKDLNAILSREKSAALSDSAAAAAAVDAEWVPRGVIHSFGRLLYESKSRFPSYVAVILAAMCAAAAVPVQSWLFAKIIVVFTYTQDPPRFTREANFWSLMWVILAVCTGLAYFVLGAVATYLAAYISGKYRQQYFENILFQKTAFFDDERNSTGTLTARVGGDPKQLEELLGMNMAMVCTSFFTLIGALAIAFAFGWKLALVATFVTAPLGVLAGFFRVRYEMLFEKMNAAVFAESSKFAAEAISAFRTVASLTLEDEIAARYQGLLTGHVGAAMRKARWTSFVSAFADSSALGCQALIFWYGGSLMASREYDITMFFVCYMAVVYGAESAGQGFSFGPNAAQASAAANRILGIRAARDRDRRDEQAAGQVRIPDTEGGIRLELQDVHFRYPTRDVAIFRGLNLTVEKGQFAALVGASGCGKTSIVSLLERFYDPQKGRILANGTDITDVNVFAYRKHLSLVAQEPTLFQGTLRENICLGLQPQSQQQQQQQKQKDGSNSTSSSAELGSGWVSDERLHAVCRDASIHDFIVSLPEGYDTQIGSKGISLSGGQKQRIAIARALMRDPDLLLLDEATSSLDSESERLVQAAFERAARGRTMVVVAHRLATVQNADVIFVLGEGKVLEKGSHGELLRRKGVYWNMCQSQALDR